MDGSRAISLGSAKSRCGDANVSFTPSSMLKLSEKARTVATDHFEQPYVMKP